MNAVGSQGTEKCSHGGGCAGHQQHRLWQLWMCHNQGTGMSGVRAEGAGWGSTGHCVSPHLSRYFRILSVINTESPGGRGGTDFQLFFSLWEAREAPIVFFFVPVMQKFAFNISASWLPYCIWTQTTWKKKPLNAFVEHLWADHSPTDQHCNSLRHLHRQSSLGRLLYLCRVRQDVFFCSNVKFTASGMHVTTVEEKSSSSFSSFCCDFINKLEGRSSLW